MRAGKEAGGAAGGDRGDGAEVGHPPGPGDATSMEDQERLVAEVMRIERRFGHELRNVRSERHDQIRETIERLARAAEEGA